MSPTKRKKKAKPVIPPKPERFLPYTVAQNGQMGRGSSATGAGIKEILAKITASVEAIIVFESSSIFAKLNDNVFFFFFANF